MDPKEFMSSAVEKYREEIQAGGVLIKFPEIGREFYVFPPQAIDMAFYTNASISNDYDYLFRMIAARARDEKGFALFETMASREELVDMMRRKMPKSVTPEVVNRVINDINDAYAITSIEDAGKN